MCLTDTVVASWSLSREVAGSSPFTVMTNFFVTEFAEYLGETSMGITDFLFFSLY